MKIELSMVEVHQLMTSFDVPSEKELISKIRSLCNDDINGKVRFVSKQSPYVFEAHMDERAAAALLTVLSPGSKSIQRIKTQVKKLNPKQITKQLGLALALKDLKSSLLRCFK